MKSPKLIRRMTLCWEPIRWTDAVTTTEWRLTPNTTGHFLCNGTKALTVFGLDNHKAIAHLPLPSADVVKFDPGLGRIYAACSTGFISVFHQDDADHYRKLEDFPVQQMVHSLAVDTATHRVYAPEQQEDGQPVARMIVHEAIDSTPKR